MKKILNILQIIIVIFILLITIIPMASSAQSDSTLFIDDIRLSLNVSNSEHGEFVDQLGFGIGVYHTFMKEQSFNTQLGLQFNRSNQVINSMYETDYSQTIDVQLQLSSLSLHANGRYSLGSKTRAIVEVGIFMEYILSAHREAILLSYAPDEDPMISKLDKSFRPNELSYGISGGIGIIFPFQGYSIIIKPEYRIATNLQYGILDSFPNRYFRFAIGMKF